MLRNTPERIGVGIIGTSHPKLASIIADIRAAQAADPRVVVASRGAEIVLGVGNTRLRQLDQAGEISSYLDGGVRKYTLASLYGYLARKATASFREDGSALKRRIPKNVYGALKKPSGSVTARINDNVE